MFPKSNREIHARLFSVFRSTTHDRFLICFSRFGEFSRGCSGVREMNGGGEGPATSGAAATVPLDWKFSQVFGERTAGEEVQEGTVLDSRFDCFGFRLS